MYASSYTVVPGQSCFVWFFEIPFTMSCLLVINELRFESDVSGERSMQQNIRGRYGEVRTLR